MAEATSNLIDNKIADKVTSTSKDSSKNSLKTDENGLEIPKTNTYLQKKCNKTWWIKISII